MILLVVVTNYLGPQAQCLWSECKPFQIEVFTFAWEWTVGRKWERERTERKFNFVNAFALSQLGVGAEAGRGRNAESREGKQEADWPFVCTCCFPQHCKGCSQILRQKHENRQISYRSREGQPQGCFYWQISKYLILASCAQYDCSQMTGDQVAWAGWLLILTNINRYPYNTHCWWTHKKGSSSGA